MSVFREKYQGILAEMQNSEFVRTIRELKKNLNERPLALYGIGFCFKHFLYWCQECGLQVSCVCDTHKKGVTEGGLPILGMQALVNDFRNAVVLICTPRYNDEIRSSLIQNGFASESIVPCPNNLTLPRETPQNFEHHLKGYEWAYSFFEDQCSQELIIDRIKMCLLGQPPRPNTVCDMYYEDGFISLSQGEIFVDCGMCYGDTVIQFIDKMKDSDKTYKKIYAFEPSASNRAAATEHLSSHNGVEIVPKGVWSNQTELFFVDGFGAESHFGLNQLQDAKPKGGHVVPVISLDLFFEQEAKKKKEGMPTFIKMDIEGSEKEALKGAANIIKQAKPKLAICAYHKPEDIYELPQTILGIRGDYRFTLRAHPDGPSYKAGPAPYEAILYAV